MAPLRGSAGSTVSTHKGAGASNRPSFASMFTPKLGATRTACWVNMPLRRNVLLSKNLEQSPVVS